MSKVNFRNTPKVPKKVKVEFYQKMDSTKEKKRCLLCGDEIEDTDPHYLVEKSWEPDNIVGLLCQCCGPSVSRNTHEERRPE